MTSRRGSKFAAAVTLVEAMVATVILAIGAVGSLSFQYHVAHQSKTAKAQLAAARTAQLLLEDWKSTGGSDKYKPSSLGLGFTSALSVPSNFSTEGGLGSVLNNAVYGIMIDGFPTLVMLQSRNISHDSAADVTLRQLSITVKFGAPAEKNDSSAEMASRLDAHLEAIAPVTLSTYTRVDASGG